MNLNGIVNFEGSCIICFITCLFFIILTYHCDYIKENIIRKLQKLYSPSRNLRAFNKSPMLFLENIFARVTLIVCMQNIHWKAFTSSDISLCAFNFCKYCYEKSSFVNIGSYSIVWNLDLSKDKCFIEVLE